MSPAPESRMQQQRIAIIGGVAAGPAAAAEAARVDPNADVVLFEQGEHISYSACEMPHYAAGGMANHRDLILFEPAEFERAKGVTVRTRHRVEAILPDRNRLVVRRLTDGEVSHERFDKFILATGARSRIPEMRGVGADGVYPVRRLDDLIHLRAKLDREEVKHAVILGGGYIGLEMAEALRRRGIRVSIVEPAGGLMNRHIDDALRPFIHTRLREHGVALRLEAPVAIETDRQGKLKAVRTDRGELIYSDVVLLCTGIVPNTDLATAAGVRLGETGAVACDESMRTNLPNVWVCGDVCEVTRMIDGAKINLPLSPVAFRTARVAARNAARKGRGAPERFPGVVVASAVKVFGLEVATVGLRMQEAIDAGFDCFDIVVKHVSRGSSAPESAEIHVRLVAEHRTGRLLGGEIIGNDGAAMRVNVLVPILRQRGTVFDLMDLDLVYNPPVSPARDVLTLAASAAAKEVSHRMRNPRW